MRVEFELNYRVEFGETICVEFADRVEPMVSSDGEWWRLTIEVEPKDSHSYIYIVRRAGQTIRREQGTLTRTIEEVASVDMVVKHDRWRTEEELRPLASSLFTNAVFQRRDPAAPCYTDRVTTQVECRCARVEPSQALAIVGEGDRLGNWGASGAVLLSDAGYPLWQGALENVERHSEFKFVIVDRVSRDILYWEGGDNRLLTPYRGEQGGARTLDVVEYSTPRFDTPLWRGVGVAIPVFSLRTQRSMGIGDFGDIRSMVDWAVEREMSVIQILPINDTIMSGTWEDSYPYNSNSTIALHPQYLALREVGVIEEEAMRESFERRAAELNALTQIDYSAVMELKMSYLRQVFKEQRAKCIKSKSYRAFVEANSWWLEPYVLFSYLRDKHQTPDFREWGSDAKFSPKLLSSVDRKGRQEMEFYTFLQYHLDRQLLAAADYARSRGVAIKGDIPIGVSRTSVDVWQHPELFRVDMQAGAPPDPFSDLGQNWGFPTYNWERMACDGFSWWCARFKKMAEYFDAYRIDHILGFFRIWQIPLGSVQGLVGHFSPALPLSPEQIGEWGVGFKPYFAEPYVTAEILDDIFSEESAEVRRKFFAPAEEGRYRFKRKYDTQRKLMAELEESYLREQLMLLQNEQLFVEDGSHQGMYHPRIMGCDTYAFASLSPSEQGAFRALHDDFYFVRHNDFWRESALRKLPTLVSSTTMMVCGEDLGMIPACVAEVMEREQILTLEIERMPKQYGVAFGDPATYPYLSVCTTSTHDMATIRGWWREDRDLIERYHREALRLGGAAEQECSGEMAKLIVDRHTASTAMLTILPWQDWMAIDELLRNPDVDAERINVPANSRHYWRYRMHLSLD
ncbi:MAG: 4-alpha-glucanotransferase [Rikenellaceae bacterium]